MPTTTPAAGSRTSGSVPSRHARDIETLAHRVAASSPAGPVPPGDVVDLLAEAVEPGLMAMPSGRFFGWVIGGTLPAALAADWLVSAWDQNAGMRYATPGVAAAEEAAAAWLLDLLRPAGRRRRRLRHRRHDGQLHRPGRRAGSTCSTEAGWDLDARRPDRRAAGPRARRRRAARRRSTWRCATSGLGAPTAVAADDQGRIRLDALAAALGGGDAARRSSCLQAGNLHSGAFDPIGERDRAGPRARRLGARRRRVRAVGRGLAARCGTSSPAYEPADSWATDAHKTLNVPYDCGIAIVADPAALRGGARDRRRATWSTTTPARATRWSKVPELSRRARGVPVWAALRSLGRSGVADLVDGLARQRRGDRATGIADDRRRRGAQRRRVHPGLRVASATTSAPATVTERLLADGTPGCPARAGAAGTCCASRSATGPPTPTTSAARIEAVRAAADAV